MNLFFVDGLLE